MNWAEWVLLIFVKVTVIQIPVLALIWFLRRSSAALRHRLIFTGILVTLSLPLLSVLVPAWNVGILAAPSNVAAEAPASSVALPGPEGGDFAASRPPSKEVKMRAWVVPESVTGWIFLIWGTGAAVLLLWLGGGHLIATRMCRKARLLKGENFLRSVDRVVDRLGISRNITVLSSEDIVVPFVHGLVEPRLVLPARALAWPEGRLEAILVHELAHVERNDLLSRLLAHLSCCLYWFNPLTWIMERRLMIEGERACDNCVLEQDIPPSEYAEHLLRVSEELAGEKQAVWSVATMAEGTDFKDRILSILDPNASRAPARAASLLIVALLVVGLVLPVAAFSPWEGLPKEEVPAQTGEPAEAVPVAGVQKEIPEDDFGDELFGVLERLLSSDDSSVKEHAIHAAGSRKEKRAIPLLEEYLNDQDPRVREHAAYALGQMGDSSVALALMESVPGEEVARVREHIVEALGNLKARQSLDLLLQLMHGDPDPGVRRHAVFALGQLGDRSAVAALIDVLQDEDELMRKEAVEALGMLGDPEAIRPLEQALSDPSASVRREAGRSIAFILGKDPD